MSDTPATHPLVTELYSIDEQIALLQARRKTAVAELAAVGPGEYIEPGGSRRATVVVPTEETVKYDLYSKSALAAFLEGRSLKKASAALKKEFVESMETLARGLAGDDFPKLFIPVTGFAPAKAFGLLVPKILCTAKGAISARGKRLLEICRVVTPPGDPYVKLPDKPKAAEYSEEE